jgi:formamidopyrimidine-DNA glycosylase
LPELLDVEAFRQYVDATSLHKSIEKVEVKSSEILGNVSAQELQARLAGRKLQFTRRYGKYLFVHVVNDIWLTLHFGMTGRLKYFKNIEEEPAHDRLLISFANGFHLAYDCQRKLGEVSLAENVENFIKEKDLGPDALELDFKTFKKILKGRRGTVKYTLMNQHIMAGIGNVYSDEILFQAGIHPTTKVNKLDEEMLKRLFEEMKNVLRTAINCQADSENLPDHYLLPHRSKGGRCPRCYSELERIKVSGRTAYYCPKHQEKKL